MTTTKFLYSLSGKYPIVIFDGDCILCSSLVPWIINIDKKEKIKFCSFQSIANDPFRKDDNYATVILVDKGILFDKSNAIFRIIKTIGGLWSVLLIFSLFPSSIRNSLYDFIAKNRYQWFGKKESCLVMTDEIRARMVEGGKGE